MEAQMQRSLTACLNKLNNRNFAALCSKFWEENQEGDEAAWRAAANHIVKLMFQPNTSHAGWTAPYFDAFGQFIAAIDRLCVDRNGVDWSFSSFIIQACRKEIQALLTEAVPEGADAHATSVRLKSGLMQGAQTLGVFFVQKGCSTTDVTQMLNVILGIDGACFAEARSHLPHADEGDACVFLMSGAPLASRPIPGEICLQLMERIARELDTNRSRVSLLTPSGKQMPRHLCADECEDGPYTVVLWSPALTDDHRIEVVCGALTPSVAAGLQATEEGRNSLSGILSCLEEISKSSSKRMQWLLDDFLKSVNAIPEEM
jgi:hypothetical protein